MADLEQFQTQQAEFDEDCNNCEDKTVNDVTPERLSRLAVESAFDVFKTLPCIAQQETKCKVFF